MSGYEGRQEIIDDEYYYKNAKSTEGYDKKKMVVENSNAGLQYGDRLESWFPVRKV